jgi:hypothetical protein
LNTSAYAHFSTYDENFSIDNPTGTLETPTQLQTIPSTDIGGFLTLTRGFLEHPEIGAGGDFRLISGKSDDRYFNASGSVIADRRESSAKQFFSGAYIEDSFTPADNLELIFRSEAIFSETLTAG